MSIEAELYAIATKIRAVAKKVGAAGNDLWGLTDQIDSRAKLVKVLEATKPPPAPAPVPVPPPAPTPVPAPPSPAPNPQQVSETFTATTMEINNPERGMYSFRYLENLDPAGIKSMRDSAQSLSLGLMNLAAFRTGSKISDTAMNRWQQSFDYLRAGGLKAVLRPVYNYSDGGLDASLATVLAHIEQLGPLLQKNADVIAYVQAGFIGFWGEWHGSSNGLSTVASKKAIHDKLRSVLSPSTVLQVRYPADLKAIGWPGNTGIHGDCILEGTTDGWTYPGGMADPLRAETYGKLDTRPFGGETCRLATGGRMTCGDALKDLRATRLVYLNEDYDTGYMNAWKAGGCWPEILRSMGYRFQLDKISHPATIARAASGNVDIDLRNVGWARIFSARPIKVSLRNKATGALIEASGGNLMTLPGQATASTRISVPLSIPATAVAGAHDVLISCPDVFPSIATDTRFAVRFANADTATQQFDTATARFSPGTQITIT